MEQRLKEHPVVPKRPKVVLASRSPRRRTLLSRVLGRHGFSVRHSAVPEMPRPREKARLFCMRIALAKALSVMAVESQPRRARSSELIVIAADTVISYKKRIIGQPKDKKDAARILRLLSGRRHQVVTGLAVVHRQRSNAVRVTKSELIIVKAVISSVWLKRLSEQAIRDYIKTGEPMDKAGAYAIQGKGRQLVRKYEGSYTNIVGLPVEELKHIIKRIRTSGNQREEYQRIRKSGTKISNHMPDNPVP